MTDGQVDRALVLGGGGVAGIAWETGMIVGLAEAGVDLAGADVVVGTSAGSVAGALLRSGLSAAAWQAAVQDEPLEASALGATPDAEQFMTAVQQALSTPAESQEAARMRLGALALQVPADRQPERVAVFEGLIGGTAWPAGRLLVTAVDAETGVFRTFDADSGAPVAEAIAASCAVPVVYPVVEIDGHRYMDGGMRSATNADLVVGARRVVVLSCGPEDPENPLGPHLGAAVAGLREAGAQVEVVQPDEASTAAFGTNMLAASSRRPAAAAGHAQAAAEADRLRALWD